jgi:hypothetical protein
MLNRCAPRGTDTVQSTVAAIQHGRDRRFRPDHYVWCFPQRFTPPVIKETAIQSRSHFGAAAHWVDQPDKRCGVCAAEIAPRKLTTKSSNHYNDKYRPMTGPLIAVR